MNLDKRLLRLARESRLALALTIGLGFAAGVVTVLQAGAISRVIDRVFLGGYSLGQAAGLLAFLLGVICARAMLAWGSEVSANAIALRVKTTLRQALVAHLLALGPAYTRGERSGELTNTLVEGVEALDAYYSQYLPQLVLAALVPLTFLIFVFPLDPLTGLVLALTAPLIPLFMALIGHHSQRLTRRQWRTLSRMSAYFLDVLQGLTTLKLFGRSRAQVGVIQDVSERFRQVTMGVLQVTFLSALALEMVSTLSMAVVAVEIGVRLLYGRLTFEQAFFVLLLAPEFYLPLRMLGTRFHAGMAGVEAAKRIFEVLEVRAARRPPTDDGRSTTDGRQLTREGGEERGEADLGKQELRLDGVRFRYPDGRLALDGVSLRLASGETVALVGPSGAGKSTVADLLLRFIRPDDGALMLGERPLEELDPAAWRSQIAWVSQAPYLLHDSVAANIRLGRADASLEQVVWAAEQAHAHDFILDLPAGYDTQVGERGARLSAGQAQRIALARAFLKDAPVLILDEATANLDLESEALIHGAMRRLLEGRTALVIAHRLNTVLLADRIAVMEAGKVIQQGTHTQLLEQGGLYGSLMRASVDGGLIIERPRPINLARDGRHDFGDQAGEAMRPEELPRTSSGQALLRLLELIAPLKGWVALSVLLGFATIASSIGLMSASAYIISAAALQPSIADLQLAIVGVRFFGIGRGVFRYLERYFSHQVTFRLLARLRTWFYQSLEPLAPARLMRFRSGDLLARILGDIETLESFYTRSLAPPLVAAAVALATSLFLARFDPLLAWTLLALLFAAGIIVPWIGRWLGREAGLAYIQRRSVLHTTLVDSIQGLSDLMAFNQEGRVLAHISTLDRAMARSQRRMARLGAMQSALSGLLAHSGMWAILTLGIQLVWAGEMQGVYLAVVTLAALTSFEAVLPLPAAALYLESNLQAARRLFEIVDAEPQVSDPPDPLPLPEAVDLEVQDLYFRYPPEPSPGETVASTLPWTLAEVTFSLPPGKRMAVVGPSGAGKTTLANLILRFWEYERGSILLGGRDLRAYQADELRGRVAVVSQNTYLFNASVRDNLRLAKPSASQDDIIQAARQAQLHEVIQSLPEGYETWIGERGVRLSGGERQRLAIARALLRNAPILILDEPTAHLDTLTERAVMETIERLMAGRTTLLITHRLVGMESMDEILVLDQGRVAARGRHADLLARGGLYRRLWDLQQLLLVE